MSENDRNQKSFDLKGTIVANREDKLKLPVTWSGKVVIFEQGLCLGYSDDLNKTGSKNILIGYMTSEGLRLCQIDNGDNENLPVWYDVTKAKGRENTLGGSYSVEEKSKLVHLGDAEIEAKETKTPPERVLQTYNDTKKQTGPEKMETLRRIIAQISSQNAGPQSAAPQRQ